MSIAILDFGSQYSQLIARRLRELQVYCELFPWHTEQAIIEAIHPQGYILSGGPSSVYDENAPTLPEFVINSGLPILGICYGMQLLVHHLGGEVAASDAREYGFTTVTVIEDNALTTRGEHQVWMSHGDIVRQLPPGFSQTAASQNGIIAAMENATTKVFGLQFHPEVSHTSGGLQMLKYFTHGVCAVAATWTADKIIDDAIHAIQTQVGDKHVLAAVSGGVDSSVAAALVHRAVGPQLHALFVDNGLLRKNERQQVESALRNQLGTDIEIVDASERFLSALKSITDPEQKRHIIGETFIRVFEEYAQSIDHAEFLVQGTIYPDVVESSAPDRAQAQRIKSHHNVGGLPTDMQFGLVEPLRYLFKDEVRAVGEALGLPHDLVWRQPFPGPGLAVRCLGAINRERLDTLRDADHIFREELVQAKLLNQKEGTEGSAAQAFAVLLPVQSVGVMGDQRTYREVIALRAVSSDDFMTADWARLPHDLLARAATRIVNEVPGVNRVVYDITSKPPATIEWE
jgi:GMP synthase (glutamine-hydrolysing)